MTRFVYVLPAGRFRWEVRVDSKSGGGGGYSASVVKVKPGESFKVDASRGTFQRMEGVETAFIVSPAEIPPLFYRRKAHALIAARAIAIIIGGEVQPHDRRGVIQDPDSYGNDPERSVG